MFDRPRQGNESKEADDFQTRAPAVSLPKGGGAIRGIGEKFAANPVTGTGSMTVPLAASPGRSGFGPELALSYDSGAGNGPFGFGWNLSLPSITRKTDKGLPQYLDADESDVFIVSGAEDLVPVLVQKGEKWEREQLPPHTVDGRTYRIQRYRPRIEGLFARIERWTNETDPADTFWRSISKDNITTLYGKTAESRIADPADPRRVFTWLICESYDDNGNAIVYTYAAENDENIDFSQANERNRERTANRYLKRITYGNRVSRLIQPDLTTTEWLFELVFDYDEGHNDALDPDLALPEAEQHRLVRATVAPGQPWTARPDPFSTYRPGFEVRTYRRCRRVLMFHHFDELGVEPYLVRSTEFDYADLDSSQPTTIEDELAHAGSTRFASFIRSVTQSGYVRDDSRPMLERDGVHYVTYRKKSLPPLEFEYGKATIQDDIRELDDESLENLPIGLDGAAYQWVDLDGEGVSGILTEQADAWFYKPNLGEGRFGPLQTVATKPSLAVLGNGRHQLLDLAGDGQLDLAEFSGPTPGFYQRTHDEDWEPFQPFVSLPNIAWDEPNLRFVDLDGDGHADVLITEHQVFTWHPSLAEDGFGPARRAHQPLDEEQGPRLVFADGTQSIYLADMCGDGLTDLVRLRNGEVCYWPNLGYGRFGAKVTMDNAPRFDHPEQFSQQRVRLADIDGSGVNDIIYLGRDGVRLYFNESGNSWSESRRLRQFPQVDNLSSVMTADLLGNGTACLVWSSPLPGDASRPLRYIDLMGGQKPHLLVKTVNNLGAETHVHYASSTKFYLADKSAGTPWITKLPFPVHVIEKVVVIDRWRQSRFATTYSYHHGYFDGEEREFRGFGRVEQTDVEDFGTFASGNAASPYISDETLYQPPVKTVTWFHTGAFLSRERILAQFREEYFAPRSDTFAENGLPEPNLADQSLSVEEWREALRACKGMMLRQEVYELDVDALTGGEERRVKLFSTAYHNCHIQCLQPRGANRHAVFLVTESEAVTYHYELDLRPETLTPDPRIAHTLNLNVDEFGNVLQSVTAVYPRISRHAEPSLPAGAEALIAQVQGEMHLAYTETRYTNDVDHPADPDNYRLRVPCEVLTYELTGIDTEDESDRESADPRDNRYFTLDELRRLRLSDVHQTEGLPVAEIAYHELPDRPIPDRPIPDRPMPQKRCVEQVRMVFFYDDLSGPMPFRQLGRLGLPYETYKLALTEELVTAIFAEKLEDADARTRLANADISGYLSGEALAANFPGLEAAGQYWIRSGIAGFARDAAAHFYLPERYTDPFGNTTTLEYDGIYDLYLHSSTDPVGNTITVESFDFRVLAPRRMRDINDNLSEVVFDILGLPAAMAVKGKGSQGDSLERVPIDLDTATLIRFFTGAYDEGEARSLLGTATARHLYYLGERREADGRITYGHHPACAAGLVRQIHVAQGGESSPLQAAFEYSDGTGTVLVTKAQAEPERSGGPLRWIANGKTVLNNKGKPVKQYEPYFSEVGHGFEEPREVGVTPIMYYDAPGRLVRTELPDGTFSRVEFSPWYMATYDQNDTVLEPGNSWYARKSVADASEADRRAARLAAEHANTAAVTHLDSLGREVIAIAHNRLRDEAGVLRDEKYLTFTKLDAEGKPLWIRDARGNRVMQYIAPHKPDGVPEADWTTDYFPCYDIAGNLLFQHSMDAGDRWMLMDAAGTPMLAWDFNERQTDDGQIEEHRQFFTSYDRLHRPVEQQLRINDSGPAVVERFVYGETLGEADSKARNLRGQVYWHYDPSGLMTNERFDFKGNLLETRRTLASRYDAPVIDWPEESSTAGLEGETFTQITEYDALNRMTRLYNSHRGEDSRVAVYEPRYNERGLLAGEDIIVGATKTATAYLESRPLPDGRDAERTTAIRAIAYNAKGQRERIDYGNDTSTHYDYDPLTFRLTHLLTRRNAATFPGDCPEPPPTGWPGCRVQNLRYTYDPVGNIAHIRDDAQQTIFFRNRRVEPSAEYTYDALYRLIEATSREHLGQTDGRPNPPAAPGQFDGFHSGLDHPNDGNAMGTYTERYSYDAVGNIEAMQHQGSDPAHPGWTRNYAYAEDSNRLLRTWLGDNELEAVRYDYDTHGSMLNLNRTSEEFRLRWDYRDMIHHVNLGGGGQAWYNYDAGKQRTRKRIERNGSTVEERLYLGGMEVYRRWIGDTLLEEIETHHLFADDQRVVIIEDALSTDNANLDVGTLYRYQYGNHLGSVGLELDGDAAVISYEECHPYGTTAHRASNGAVRTTAKRYRYTGMERDEETGLSYHTARYYLPWLGRWVASDPIGIDGGFNIYSYCHGDPISLVDKGGLQPEPFFSVDALHGYGEGLWDSAVELRDVAGEFLERPLETSQAMGNALLGLVVGTPEDPVPPTARAIWEAGGRAVDDFNSEIEEGDARGAARVAGHAVGMIATPLAGGRVLTLAVRTTTRLARTAIVASVATGETAAASGIAAAEAAPVIAAASEEAAAAATAVATGETAAASGTAAAETAVATGETAAASGTTATEALQRIELIERMQQIVNESAQIADDAIAQGDRSTLEQFLTPTEATRLLGGGSLSAARRGVFIEWRSRLMFALDESIQPHIGRGGFLGPRGTGGRRAFADFIGTEGGLLSGMVVDITTLAGRAAHLARGYLEKGLILTH